MREWLVAQRALELRPYQSTMRLADELKTPMATPPLTPQATVVAFDELMREAKPQKV